MQRPALLFALLLGALPLANGLTVAPAMRTLASARTTPRAAPPHLVIGRVRQFVGNRLLNPFKRDEDSVEAEMVAASMVAAEELELPPPVALDDDGKKKLSMSDKFLVGVGMKTEDECEIPEEGEDLMEQIKCAGRAGIISYILWEWAFWLGGGGLACFTYYKATGAWPDLSNPDEQAQIGASVFAFVNVARFAVPLRIGLALGTTPWVDDNIVKPFLGGDDDEDGDEGKATATA